MGSGGLVVVLIFIVGVIVLVIGCIGYLYYGRLWFRAHVKDCPVSLGQMLSMTLNGADASRIVNAYVDAYLAGLEVSLDALEKHDRARGHVRRVVRSMIRAQETGTNLSFDEARTLDLQGKAFSEGPNSSD